MAAAEARTTWQRTASRCYFHDGVREKYSSCPSSSCSSKSEFDYSPDNAAKDHLHPFANYDVLTGRRRWWLNQEPNFVYHKNFISEEGISLEAQLEILSNDVCEESQTKKGFIAKTSCSMEQLRKVSVTCNENGQDTRIHELKAVSPRKTAAGKDVRDLWYLDEHYLNLDSLNCLVSQDPKKLSSDYESHWVGADKTEPWWRSACKDDLASLVAQKSLEHIENCDLPRPRAKNYRKQQQPSACSQNFDHDDVLSSPLDQMSESRFSNMDYSSGSPNSGCSPHETFRHDAQDSTDNDQSKAQLLKALCLSQKRAREAEKAAKQAYSEKEHIITLLFRQASQLFAYKQWLQLLQIENICLQLKSKNQPIGNLFPSVKAPCKGSSRQAQKGHQHRAGKKRQGKPQHEINKSVVAFALGLGLASAGLLLGWTMGWLFPAI
ncbi:uncharacterized protein LOC133834473 isoform X2 [Humulus lupulus]|uniref:uncharacterized protein LOC133834473 isoform X2 n=1 Tax=Humulus lupulus TaxID=3486 RepID=UPI002B40868A|nr:uncharacterized protein LOC133834473 isoform X2 [Humulus lupulus]